MSLDPQQEVNHRKRRRNRMRVSCLNCYASKRKCDRKRPCTRCVKHGLTGLCVYELDDPDTRDPALDETTHLRNRIAELESVIRELNNRPHPRWFAPNGVEHVPELVAARRSSAATTSTAGSPYLPRTSSFKRRKIAHRARSPSTPESEEASLDDITVKTKRKCEADTPETIMDASPGITDAFFDSEKNALCHTTVEGSSHGKSDNAGHDDPYHTDEEEDDGDEDYEDYGSRSRFKAASKRLRSSPNKRTQSIGNRCKLFLGHPHDTVSNVKAGGPVTSYRRTSTSTSTSTCTSFDHKDKATIDSPLTPPALLPPILLDGHDHMSTVEPAKSGTKRPSALDPVETGDADGKRSGPVDEFSSPEGPPLSRCYPLRTDVIWSDPNEIMGLKSHTSKAKGTNSSTSPYQRKGLVKNGNPFKEKANDNNGTSPIRSERHVDAVVQTSKDIEAEISLHLKYSPNPCFCLSNTKVCNDLAFLFAVLRDTRNVLKTAHDGTCEERHGHATAYSQSECELLKRISGLDDYVSAMASETDIPVTSTDDAVEKVTPDGNTAESSSSLIPGERLDVSGLRLNPAKTTTRLIQNITPKSPIPSVEITARHPFIISSAKNVSNNNKVTTVKAQQLRSGQRRGRKTRMSVSDATTDSTTIVPAATFSPTPTPASILERASCRLPSNRGAKMGVEGALPPSVTLASVLADTLSTDDNNAAGSHSTSPPRFLRTSAPTSLVSTPTFSPSSPLLRPMNSAIRRPDADFLPFYSYALSGFENDAEREYHQHSGKMVTTTLPRSGSTPQPEESRGSSGSGCLVPLNFGPLLGNEVVVDVGTGVDVGRNTNASSPGDGDDDDIPVAAAQHHQNSRHQSPTGRPLNSNDKDLDVAMNMELDVDVDVDAEGEPAPESGYQYSYFEDHDGYRYEYVCVGEV